MTAEGTTGGRTKSATSKDVELEKCRQRARIFVSLIWACAVVIIIPLLRYPLELVRQAVGDLAGQDTRVSVKMSMVISIAGLAAVVTGLVRHIKGRNQRDELIRTRERLRVLEEQLRELKKELKATKAAPTRKG